ncbi:DNA cytosine methyltransferase [Ornithinimicrobium tianjinense]|uniref:Cytosine-specific methyltransferase n=1 Tax=Ornithinimicrobium tianjinense TaxID=1195761 RepID=A0A917F4Z0_9MICO|nr:DNA (cytosine-5-)-methyltransferase [Ornithinimicrobium tianjinense]GGF43702.1 putative BsuMI modification methylase subunit YdiP [Ornithinimicrobium tianjinense]
MTVRMAGLFAGIGGIELGLRDSLGDGLETTLLCEWWEPAKQVLGARFPGAPLHPDVRELSDLPADVDLVAAGFPCTDLSQAGRTAGIRGEQSGLVSHVFAMLRKRVRAGLALPNLLIENVPNMLSLDRGEAMAYLVEELEALGYAWAYRVVDTRATGLPQRRRRVILLASATLDPKTVLFADEAGERPPDALRDDAFGFYWTEGRGGLGWAPDAVPTLKGGSTVGIASPPAIWIPDAAPQAAFVTPSVEDAEMLQGFPRGWTDVDFDLAPARAHGTRWKLVGNAVTTRIAAWVGGRLGEPGEVLCPSVPWTGVRWPTAAAGYDGVREQIAASEYPILEPYQHLLDIVDVAEARSLSPRAIAGFHNRLRRGNLGKHPGFRDAVASADLALNPPTLFAVS